MTNLIQTEKSKWMILHLNRPDKKNALDLDLIQNLIHVFSDLKKTPHIEGVVLYGEGDCFCSGADLNWILSSSFDARLLFNLFHTIETYDNPVIAHAQGAIYGGGIGLLSVCDFISAETKSRFCFSELKWGLAPAVIMPFVLKKISLHQAGQWMLTAQTFDAQEALKHNLINYSGSLSECKRWEDQLIENLKSLHLPAFRKTKSLLRQISRLSEEQIQKTVTQCLAERQSDPLVRKNLSSFLKRTPH